MPILSVRENNIRVFCFFIVFFFCFFFCSFFFRGKTFTIFMNIFLDCAVLGIIWCIIIIHNLNTILSRISELGFIGYIVNSIIYKDGPFSKDYIIIIIIQAFRLNSFFWLTLDIHPYRSLLLLSFLDQCFSNYLTSRVFSKCELAHLCHNLFLRGAHPIYPTPPLGQNMIQGQFF